MFIKKGRYSIRSCNACGLRFLWPQPQASELEALYGDSYFANTDSGERGYSDYLAQAENHRRLFRDRLTRLPPLGAAARLLDFGAAAGFFIEQASQNGWHAEGVEINDRMVRYGREVLGCKISNTDLPRLLANGVRFDIVTMWEVIEHLPDPRETLQDIHELLNPGGYIALTTPDSGSLIAKVLGRRWLGWQKVPEHLFFFDARNLKRLLFDCGFEIDRQYYVPLFVDLEYALERLSAVLHIPFITRLAEPWKARSVTINPYYDLMLVARRR